MSSLRSWTNRERLVKRLIQESSTAVEVVRIGHAEIISVCQGPVNDLGWGTRVVEMQTESFCPELSPRFTCSSDVSSARLQ